MDLSKFFTPLYERVRSPFISTFIISWSTWNWEIIYTTVFVDSEKLTIPKIEYIKQNYFDYSALNGFSTFMDHVVFPLGFTVLYLTIFQEILTWAFEKNEEVKSKRKNRKFEINKETPVSRFEFLQLMDDLENEKNKYKNIQREKSELITEVATKTDANQKLEQSKISLTADFNKQLNTQGNEIAKLNNTIENMERQKSLIGVFEGSWRLDYRYNNNGNKKGTGFDSSEAVYIDAINNRYLANGQEDFELKAINVDIEKGTITFVKRGVNKKNTVLYCELIRNSPYNYTGTEWETGDTGVVTHAVSYSKT